MDCWSQRVEIQVRFVIRGDNSACSVHLPVLYHYRFDFLGETMSPHFRKICYQLTASLRNKTKSWTARDTLIQPPHRIEWESTSGMKNMGSVEFIPNNNSGTNSGNSTEMIVSFTFVAPRVVAGLFRRSNRIRRFTEDVLLMNMLTGFRDVVVEEDL
mmetsp:Transcript_33054/g.67907  ORF Transcript_33054/g.67907 Transcript_33054/m.67907 type:complete len:157 (+) Transcript_33054:735-1205(+)